MYWFKYYPAPDPPEEIPEEDYAYPFLRRSIESFLPSDRIEMGQWLFVDVSLLDIDSFYDGALQPSVDPTSYIMVYETSFGEDDFQIVSSLIDGDFLYFQAAKDHFMAEPIQGSYSLYYKTPNLKELSGDQVVDSGDVDLFNYVVTPGDFKTYSFSFVNSVSDWENGFTSFKGSKVYGNFSGPNFILKGDKGPNGGIIKFKLTALTNEDFPVSQVVLDNIDIDTYSSVSQEDIVLYSLTNLDLRDYTFEVTNSYNKNILSTGNDIYLRSFSFTYNPYIKFGPEMINRDAHVYSQINGVR